MAKPLPSMTFFGGEPIVKTFLAPIPSKDSLHGCEAPKVQMAWCE